MSGKEILRVEKAAFAYGDYRVYGDISFSVHEGEVFCLMGPNGCGKTTLIDTVLGIHRPAAGSITLCGRPLTGCKRHEIAQYAAYVPQLHHITFPFTVLQVVMMGRTAYTGLFGEPDDEDEAISREALAKVGMESFADRPYSLLSGGEIKLVLLARALGQKTPLIVLDEPTAHLDFRNELIFLETIADICAREQIAVLMATHVPNHAFYFESRGLETYAALMRKGEKSLCAAGRAGSVLTEEALAELYGVSARIVSACENGREAKTVALFGTIK